MSLRPHNPWRARAARAGLSLAIVAAGAGAVHATPVVPDLPNAAATSQAPQPTAGSAPTPAPPPRKRAKRPRGQTRTIASAPAVQVPEPPGRMDVVGYALEQRGVPYRWGGASPEQGFDCSGLVMYAWGRAGVAVPHYTVAIWNSIPRVIGPLQPADLVFFGMGHMGMYIGQNRFVHAPQTGDVVRITSMAPGTNYGRRFSGAVRPG